MYAYSINALMNSIFRNQKSEIVDVLLNSIIVNAAYYLNSNM